MEDVVERSNLKLAYQRVVENKGAPGVDDVSIRVQRLAEDTLAKRFSVTVHRESRLRIAPASVQRLRQKVRDLMRTGRGRSLDHG
jgi:hypothetical protein